MSLTRAALGFALASALLVSAVPAFASAQTLPYNYNNANCGYQYNTNYYQNGYCPQGNLFVFVQVQAPANSFYSRPVSDFTATISGDNAYPATVQGSTNGQLVSVVGSYSVSAATFTGFTPSYSSGCTGSLSQGQYASCVITETPTNLPNYNQNNQPYFNYSYPYNNSLYAPAVYVTPMYVPRLPNTGFEPQDGAAVAFAIVVLIAVAFLTLPYVRKAFASIVG